MASNRSLLSNALNQRVHLQQPTQPRLGGSRTSLRVGGGGGESVRAEAPRLKGLSRPEARQPASEQTPSRASAPAAFKPHGGHEQQSAALAASNQAQAAALAAQQGNSTQDPAVTHAQQMLAMDAINAPARKVAQAMQSIGDGLATGKYAQLDAKGQPVPDSVDTHKMYADAMQAGLMPEQLTPLFTMMSAAQTASTKQGVAALYGALNKTYADDPRLALNPEAFIKATMDKIPPALRDTISPKDLAEPLKTFGQASLDAVGQEVARKVQLGQLSPQAAKAAMDPLYAGAQGAGIITQKDQDAAYQHYGIQSQGERAANAKSLAGAMTTAAGKGGMAAAGTASGDVVGVDPTDPTKQTRLGGFNELGEFVPDPAAQKAAGVPNKFWNSVLATVLGGGKGLPGLPGMAANAVGGAIGRGMAPQGGAPAQGTPQPDIQPGMQAQAMGQAPGAAGGAPAPQPVQSAPVNPQGAQQLTQPPAPPSGANVNTMLGKGANEQDPRLGAARSLLGLE